MRRMCRTIFSTIGLAAVAFVWAGPTLAQPLTADHAVRIALQHNSQVINAEAAILDARSGVYGSYSGLLPRLSASYSRSALSIDHQSGRRIIGGVLSPPITNDFDSYSTVPSVSGSWTVLNLSSITGFRSAQSGLKAARLQKTSTRQDVALSTRRQFYEVVKAIQLEGVAGEALRLARDSERRVNALFQVGSVSKSDVLKAQVLTAQGELDSLTAGQSVTNQRIVLAELLGIRESELGEVDTILTVQPQSFDESSLLGEAEHRRPDLLAADAEVNAARSGVNAARYARLPYVTVGGSADFNTKTSQTTRIAGQPPASGKTDTDRQLSGQIALNWDFFDALSTDARNAAAQARLMRAREARDALRRNLGSEIHQTLLAYRQALAGEEVASRAIESSTENLKLTQQKYNVGSATILDLIDAQVQLQRARSDRVAALAAIRVAEAQINRVRGLGE